MSSLAALSVACGAPSEDPGSGSAAAEVNEGAARSAPSFLSADRVADLVTLSPSFPFGVTRRHAASGAVLGAHWGAHGGPVVTTQNFSDPASALTVHRWTLPNGVTDAATQAELTSVIAPSLPNPHFWGIDGFVDLPFGSLSMHAYSGSGAHFAGEVLFFTKDYDRVVGRAHVNGFYSGVGVGDGTAKRLVYSGLSGVTSDASATEDDGLYASDVCGDSPAPSGACGPSVKLFGWRGNSGPVAADADGNVFVAAFVTGGAESDAVFGISKTQTFAAGSTTPATISEKSSGGTGSIAAASAPGSGKGWMIAKGQDGKQAAPSYARAYHSTGSALIADGAIVEDAIVGTSPDASLSFFSDPTGHLWVAVELPDTSWLLELQPRP